MRYLNAMSVTALLIAGPAAAVSLSGPIVGQPDQPFASKRAVTAADKAAIQSYRSGKQATFSTNFNDAAGLQANWDLLSDDPPGLRSCRRPGNVEASGGGLKLETRVGTDCKTAKWTTGTMESKAKYSYGFYEASIKIADIKGLNNAFWLTTDDKFELDIPEIKFPGEVHFTLHKWPTDKSEKHAAVAFNVKVSDNLANGYHDYGALWTPKELIFEIDGQPVAVLVTNNAIAGPANVRFSTALADWAGAVPEHPEGHDFSVKSFKYISQ